MKKSLKKEIDEYLEERIPKIVDIYLLEKQINALEERINDLRMHSRVLDIQSDVERNLQELLC